MHYTTSKKRCYRPGLPTVELQVFINKIKTNVFCSNKIKLFYVGSMGSSELGHVTQTTSRTESSDT